MKKKLFGVPYIFTTSNKSFSNDDYLKIFFNFDDTKYREARKLNKPGVVRPKRKN